MEPTQLCRIRVDGVPKPQPRARAFAVKGHARVYSAHTAEAWKSQIAEAVRSYIPPAPLEGAMRMRIVFDLPRPKRLCRRKDPPGRIPHTGGRDDIDNLIKAVLDALTTVGLWRDDSQVYWMAACKFYHAIDGKPGADIWIGTDE